VGGLSIRLAGGVSNPPCGASLSRVGTERHGLKGRKPISVGICQEWVKKLNESKPFDDMSKLTFTILKTMCVTVTWDKEKDYQFIGCPGIRHKDGRSFT